MRSALVFGCLFCAAPVWAQAEDQKLATRFKVFLDEEFRNRPLEATRAGDHRFDDRLDDISPEAHARTKARLQNAHDELPREIAYDKLSRDGQIDFEIWRQYLERELWLMAKTDPFAEDPRVYNNYITESVYALLTQSTEPKHVNIKNAVSRIGQIPRIVEEAKRSLKAPPKVLVETAIRQNRGAIAFFERGIYEVAGETPQLSDLRPAIQKILPSLEAYQTWLERELLPRANGEWRLGKAKFAEKLELELNAAITAEEVLQEAEAEANRVEAEMYVIARQFWHKLFPKTTLPADDEKGRRKTIRAVLDQLSNEHAEPDQLVAEARATADAIKEFIRAKDILKLPEPDRCQIIEMPEFQRGNSVAFLNPAPPLDVKAPSIYAVSPPPREWDAGRVRSFMKEYNRHMLKILTIHEAFPGHYVQLEYSNRNSSLIRKILYSGVFAEGWAVYTEQMMLDEGFGGGDPALRLMQLKWYLRAVVNAILDHRMHCLGMTDQEALTLLMDRAFQSEGEAILKIIRAKQSSCQLSTYFVGRVAFQRLRRRFQNEMGDEFSLGRYHEAALAHGTLPVRYLPELVGGMLKKR
ncbi:MAG: DUF885 domain-containing protein [Planctomycetota bacterium]